MATKDSKAKTTDEVRTGTPEAPYDDPSEEAEKRRVEYEANREDAEKEQADAQAKANEASSASAPGPASEGYAES